MANVIEGICCRNDLLEEQYTEVMDGYLDATRKLRNKVLVKKQEVPVIKPVRASLIEKSARSVIAAKDDRLSVRVISSEGDKERKPPRRLRVSHYWQGGA